MIKGRVMTQQQRQKILVIGEDTRSFLSVIRSLGRAGYCVDVVCYDQLSPSLKSKYISQAYFLNYQAYTNSELLEQLIQLVTQQQYQVVVPCDERAIFPLVENQHRFPAETILAIPNQEVVDNLFDKNSTKILAEKLDIAHAKGRLLSLETLSYEELKQEFGTTFVVKPTLSFKSDVLSKRQKVEIIDSESSYRAWKQKSELNDLYLVECFFSGKGEGVSILAVDGKVLASFAHKRVSEPKSGGGSSYRKSIKLDDRMANACAKICQATNYTGVGMFEFKKNEQTGDWILIEVNARFWGSLPLAIYAGIDFPVKYIQALLEKSQGISGNGLKPLGNAYKVDVFGRSLVSDIFDIKKEIEFNLRYSSKLKTFVDLLSRLFSFGRILLGKERIDTFQSDDSAPFKNEVSQFYNETIAPKFPWNKHADNRKVMAELMQLLRHVECPSFKIVCYGNIMRSPFAEMYLKKICSEEKLHWQIESYGFHINSDRKSPEECVSVGKEMQIDLSEHRSKWLRQEHICDNDIVIIFDESNKDKIDRYYKADKVFNLAHLIPADIGQFKSIDDPYGKGEQAVRQCYIHIASALDSIVKTFKSE